MIFDFRGLYYIIQNNFCFIGISEYLIPSLGKIPLLYAMHDAEAETPILWPPHMKS